MMMNGYGMMGGLGLGGFGIVFFILQLLFWVAIIYVIFLAIKKFNSKVEHNSSIGIEDKSIQILKDRYARGEISEEEYKKVKEVLSD